MSDVKVRAALENRLNAMVPALATAWENKAYKPVTGVPYQKVSLMRAAPDNPVIDGFHRLAGLFQVTLLYPQSVGPAAAEARAELLKAWFPYRLSLVKDTVTVVIDGTPYIMAGFEDGDRWAIPVRVSYYANIGG